MECSDKDLHSGVYGGSVHEAMTDLITLMGKQKQVSLTASKMGVRAIKAWVSLQWGGFLRAAYTSEAMTNEIVLVRYARLMA